MVKELITLERKLTCKTARKFSQEVTGRKSSLQNDWLIFHKGVGGRYLFAERELFSSAVFSNFNFGLEGTLSRVTTQQPFG